MCAKPAFKNFCIGVSSHLANIRNDTKKYLFAYLNLVIKQKKWAMGYVRSRFKESSDTEKASLFHLNREQKNSSKNNVDSMKIGEEVTDDKNIIETEALDYFGALVNGHHDNNLNDTGKPFVPLVCLIFIQDWVNYLLIGRLGLKRI